jgi:surface polysaccharide O-acyltransferase-like enzyme
MAPSASQSPQRHAGLEALRVLCSFLVVLVHAGEPFYMPDLSVEDSTNARAAAVYGSVARVCVPLFVMLTGYYLWPVPADDVGGFLRRRLGRLLPPFVAWVTLYEIDLVLRSKVTPAEAAATLARAPFHFSFDFGHLWHVYMLVGLVLYAPVLSPWVTSAPARHLRAYLAAWSASLLLPYLRAWVAPAWWGEAWWNSTPTLYYFSGLGGYAVAGAYLRRFPVRLTPHNVGRAVGTVALATAFTAAVFLRRLRTEAHTAALELSWTFDSANIAAATVGLFVLFAGVGGSGGGGGNAAPPPSQPPSALRRALAGASRLTYGVFCGHMVVLNAVHGPVTQAVGGSAALAIPAAGGLAWCLTLASLHALSLVLPHPLAEWVTGVPPPLTSKTVTARADAARHG